MADLKEKKNGQFQLRSVDDLTEAHEWLFNSQRSGTIDNKAADAINTTLKGATYLRVKLRLDMLKLSMQAQKQKISMPPGLLPQGMEISG